MNVFTGVGTIARLLIVILAWTAAWSGVSARPTADAPQGATSSRVLVMPFVVETAGTEGAAGYWMGEAATLLLTDELQVLDVDALPRAERVTAFDRLHLPMSATLTRATLIRAGELLGVRAIIVGDVRVDDRVRVRARLIWIDTGQQRAEVTKEGRADELFPVFEDLARAMATDIAGHAPRAARAHTHPPLPAFESYVKGLVAGTPATQESFLIDALRAAPLYDQARLALWGVQTAEGTTAKALATARAVSPASPLFRAARFDEALSLIDLKRYDEARLVLDALRTERPSAIVANAIGVTQLRKGSGAELKNAIASFARAVSDDPECADCQFNLGYASALSGDSTAALHWLREAVRREPADGDAHWVLSMVLMATAKAVEAQRELDLAKLIGAPHADAATALTERVPKGLERLRTDLDAPVSPIDTVLAEAAQRDQSQETVFHLDHARRLLLTGQDRGAAEELRRAIFLSPYQDEPHLLLGAIDQRSGRLSDAIDEFKLALWSRESVAAHVALGGALLDAGKRDAARAEAERALILEPGAASAKALLAKIGLNPVLPFGHPHV